MPPLHRSAPASRPPGKPWGLVQCCLQVGWLCGQGPESQASAPNSSSAPRPMSSSSTSDVVIVGAGIVGLAHAWAAARAGMSVTVVERDTQARGASVRNFGMLATIAQPPGRALRRAERSQERLAAVAAAAGVPLSRPGCVIAARTGEEEAVLAAFAGSHDRTEFLPPGRLREICPLLRPQGLRGGLWAPRSARLISAPPRPGSPPGWRESMVCPSGSAQPSSG